MPYSYAHIPSQYVRTKQTVKDHRRQCASQSGFVFKIENTNLLDRGYFHITAPKFMPHYREQ
jgi:hypothetical protein